MTTDHNATMIGLANAEIEAARQRLADATQICDDANATIDTYTAVLGELTKHAKKRNKGARVLATAGMNLPERLKALMAAEPNREWNLDGIYKHHNASYPDAAQTRYRIAETLDGLATKRLVAVNDGRYRLAAVG